MEKFVIKGNTPLKGEVNISGAKNSALGIIPATLLTSGVTTLHNVPHIEDVLKYLDILEELGAKVTWIDEHSIVIDSSKLKYKEATSKSISEFRASYYLLGTFLSKFHKAAVGLPGGCSIGKRPIDQHLKGFEALNANVVLSDHVTLKSNNLKGNKINFDVISVGATINLMLAATGANGETILNNVAKEPHVIDVANFLISIGANIQGAGTDQIRIVGPTNFKTNTEYYIVPDQIEAGTFMVAAAHNGDILIKNCIPKDLKAITKQLKSMGVYIEEGKDFIHVKSPDVLKATNIVTAPHPGFPTDMQAQLGVLLSIAKGKGTIHETIWESRFAYLNELKKMGANISLENNIATFEGPVNLKSAEVYATDLRAGAALIIACIFAQGESELHNISHIDRGYEQIEDKFKKLGANIKRVYEEENNG